MSGLTCQLCQSKVPEVVTLDANTKSRIMAETGQIMEAICKKCLENFKKAAERRKGVVYSKEQQRLTLWRSRIQLIRDARDKFTNKDYAGSAVAYEKYFKIIESIYDVKVSGIKSKDFNNPGRAKEMAVMTTAFWDLVRIYDLSGKYRPKLELYADKLADFLPHTPLHGEVAAKLSEYRLHAKHKDIFENLYKKAKRGGAGGRCFIATATFQSPLAPEVIILSRFRDEILVNSSAGRTFIKGYYLISPWIAGVIDKQPVLQDLSKHLLKKVVRVISKIYGMNE